ncbi:hypothetical protein Aph02nite_42810 [Actinoplanes philippinensis]|nr:hypothetical protein Aph02nite_42810 [Actinoplanes philippinensis]
MCGAAPVCGADVGEGDCPVPDEVGVWPSAGARLDAGGPGFGRLRPGDGRRASERLRFGTLMSVPHDGRRP